MAAKIGWIGTGVMGRSMCLHLRNAGYEVSVYNRSKDKAQDLLDAGAVWCDTPAGVADGSEAVFSIVGYPRDVEEVFLGSGGVLAATASGSMVIDMTTSEPALAKRLHAQAAQRGVASLDAPVSGGDLGARAGTLAIMVGGDRADYDRAMPYFEIMGENIAYMGSAGAGQHTKMSNQILIASTMVGVVESLLYGHKAGLDRDEIIAVIGKGAASCFAINNLAPRIVKGDFEPGFYIKHFVKDMGIALAEAQAMRLALPGLSLANQFYTAAMAEGLEDRGTQALYKVLERLSS